MLVGWSDGGRVMAYYLKTHGTAKLAGLNYVDAGHKPTRLSSDLISRTFRSWRQRSRHNIAATRAFLRDCFSKQPSQDEFEMMLSFNMMVPPKVRLGLSNRPLEVDDLLKSSNSRR